MPPLKEEIKNDEKWKTIEGRLKNIYIMLLDRFAFFYAALMPYGAENKLISPLLNMDQGKMDLQVLENFFKK